MKTVKYILASLFILLGCSVVQAQSFGNRLGRAIENAAERTVIRKAEQKTEEAISTSIDKATNPDTYKNDEKDATQEQPAANQERQPAASQGQPAVTGEASGNTSATETAAPAAYSPKEVELTYAKSDFVSGDEIIFSDDLANEKLGEFPSQWDLLNGVVEVAAYDGLKVISFEVPTDAHIAPLMEDMKNYLPDVFTIEFDFWVNDPGSNPRKDQQYVIYFRDTNKNRVATLTFASFSGTGLNVNLNYKAANSDETRSSSVNNAAYKKDSWNHLSVSFNKRAFKAYINGVRFINIPAMTVPNNLDIQQYTWGGFSGNKTAITNVRIAKGAVPLYERMMSDGKFITYGITFDVGKSTIRPESMGEINRIATMMNDNTDLKFSVEGHTDSTGNATTNQTLSEARSKAIVDKLVEMGIAANRLNSAGKGQNNPIGDNSTDEGRAKNRRVEFVKI